MRYDNTHGYVSCPQCGKRFLSDCGVDFCSTRCENEYEDEHSLKECERCGTEYQQDELNDDNICEYCEEEE